MADNPTLPLARRVALVTGAGGGIGRATGLRLAADGARVAVNDVDEAAVRATVAAVEDAGGEAMPVPGSVAAASDADAMVDAIVDTYGRLDILINNAGITRDALTVKPTDDAVKRMDESAWDAVLEINLKGTFLCCRAAAVPMIRQQSGRIVNTSSVAAFGNVGQANYAASKAGIIGLTKTLALELARYKILVNCVAPGAVATPMTAGIPDKIRERLVAAIPLRRMADAAEIAAVHAFLVSDDASYITGQCLVVDAGLKL